MENAFHEIFMKWGDDGAKFKSLSVLFLRGTGWFGKSDILVLLFTDALTDEVGDTLVSMKGFSSEISPL